MKASGYEIPDGLFYTKEHEWADVSGKVVRVGVTEYAAKSLNDVVYVTLPKKGGQLEQLKPMGTLESIKAVSELYSPVSGVVTNTNDELQSHPELVNKSPYGEGWLIEVMPRALQAEKKQLLDAKAYASFLETLIEK